MHQIPHEGQNPQYPERLALVQPDEIFKDFQWREQQKPDQLHLNGAGFMEDGAGNWYLVRKAKNAIDLQSALPHHNLYNATRDRYWNSTEGRGLYFANHPAAVESLKLGIRSAREPGQLYVCRVKPDDDRVLDVSTPLRYMSAGQKAAAILLRSRSLIPGIPSPSRDTYDRMYGDAAVVATPPLALSRILTGNTSRVGMEKMKVRWAIVREPDALEIVAHRSI